MGSGRHTEGQCLLFHRSALTLLGGFAILEVGMGVEFEAVSRVLRAPRTRITMTLIETGLRSLSCNEPAASFSETRRD